MVSYCVPRNNPDSKSIIKLLLFSKIYVYTFLPPVSLGEEMQAPVCSASSLESNITSWTSQKITCDKEETHMILTKIPRILFSIYQVIYLFFLAMNQANLMQDPWQMLIPPLWPPMHKWKIVMKISCHLKIITFFTIYYLPFLSRISTEVTKLKWSYMWFSDPIIYH